VRYLLYLSILLPNTGLLIGLALVLSLLHVIPLHDYLEVPCHVEEAFTLFWKASQRNEISGPQRRSRLIDLRALVLVVLSTCTMRHPTGVRDNEMATANRVKHQEELMRPLRTYWACGSR